MLRLVFLFGLKCLSLSFPFLRKLSDRYQGNFSCFFLILLVTGLAQGQTSMESYSTSFDSLFNAKKMQETADLAAEWQAEAEARFGDSSPQNALALNRCARVNISILGNYPIADSLYTKSIEIFRLNGQGETFECARSLYNSAFCKNQQKDFQNGLKLLEEALDIYTRLLGQQSSYTLLTMVGKGWALQQLHRNEEAESNYLALFSIIENNKLWGEDAYMRGSINYSELLYDQSRFTRAIELLTSVFQNVQAFFGEKSTQTTKAKYNLSVAYLKSDQPEMAEPIFRELIETGGPNNQIEALHGLASAQLRLDLIDESEANFLKEKQLLEQYGLTADPFYQACLTNLAGVYQMEKRFAASDSMYSEAANLLLETQNDSQSDIYISIQIERAHLKINNESAGNAALILEQLEQQHMQSIKSQPTTFGAYLFLKACLAREQGNPVQALQYFEQSLQLSEPSSPRYASKLRSIASLQFFLNQHEAAEKNLNKFLALRQNESSRKIIQLTDRERQMTFEDFRKDFDFGASLLLKDPKLKARENLAEVQLFSKNILELSARKAQAFFQNNEDPELAKSYSDWLDLREKINFISTSRDETSKKMEISVQSKFDSLEKTLALRGTPGFQLKNDPRLSDIRKALSADEAAVDIMLFNPLDSLEESYTDQLAYAACIIRPDSELPDYVFLENGNELESFLYGQYQNEITRKKDLSANLYEKMWAPIAAHLQGVKTVYFSPDGIFHKINLNTLRAADGAYLLDKIQLKQVTNLRNILDQGQETSGSELGMAALFGNPAFKTGAISTQSAAPADLTARTSLYRDIVADTKGDLHLSPLPGSEREVNAIAQKLKDKNWQTTVFTGEKATEDTLKQLKSPKVLHIATHGYFLNSEKTNSANGLISPRAGKNPALRSMLFFAGAENSITGENTGHNDGILTAFEAAVLNLDQTELVVLSACSTGLGKIQNGEGVYGLQRAFRIAGAKSLIMSLWEVEDAATELLMNGFYENWLSGMSKTEAFRKAQLTLKTKYPQPFYWGSFILVNG